MITTAANINTVFSIKCAKSTDLSVVLDLLPTHKKISSCLHILRKATSIA